MVMENKQPYLVQTSSTLQIGSGGNILNSTSTALEVKNSANTAYSAFTTGDLTVKGNLRVEKGHVSEFDVGTAIFQDKLLELGASDYIYSGMSDGTGILAVDSLVADEHIVINITGDTANLISSSYVESRNLVVLADTYTVDVNITATSSAQDVVNLLNKTANFTNYCTAVYEDSTSTIIIKSKDGSNIIDLNVSRYEGYRVAFDYNKGGWNMTGRMFNTSTGQIEDRTMTIGPSGITLSTPDVFTINASSINVPDDYVITDNSLITKKYFSENNTSVLSPSAGLGKGVEMYEGYITADLTKEPSGSIKFADTYGTTVVCPWMQSEFMDLDEEVAIFDFSNASGDYLRLHMSKINNVPNLILYYSIEGTTNAIDIELPVTTEDDWIQPVLVFNKVASPDGITSVTYLDVYNSHLLLQSIEHTLPEFEATNLTIGYDSEGTYYNGIMIGEFIVLNDALYSSEVKARASSGIWVSYSRQSALPKITSGELQAGKEYYIYYVEGDDFSMCGLDNTLSSEEGQICTTTATPVWTNGSYVVQTGALIDLVFRPTNDSLVDMIDVSNGVNATFTGVVNYNDTFPPMIGLSYTS